MSKTSNKQTGEGEDTVAIEEASLDTFLKILADTDRRQLLVALLDHDPLDDDYFQIPADVTRSDEQESHLSLQMTHIHLPKLDNADIIEWNRDDYAVRKGPRFDDIRPLVQMVRKQAD
ncbi:hypothetical protein BG842_09600 [Haladaptatus sp. W1]|uniref:hypothetical protein n=1 Tax=Haladaptatus sp. W1 TaxID=1897478 RepID=UPI000849EAB7|nr:hypothetical protein [Haladaptatus sp. W1]ODR82723.1 hypothetical protein BG842_09600 [Haladaptatus sp. W1]